MIKIPFCSYSAKNSWITYIGSEQRPQRININKKISEKDGWVYFFFIFSSASLYTSYKTDFFSYVSFSLFFAQLWIFFILKKYKARELHLPWWIKKCLWWMQVIRNISYYYFFSFNSFGIYAKHKTFNFIAMREYIRKIWKKIVTLALSSFFSPLRESCSTAESFWLFLMILHLIAFFSFFSFLHKSHFHNWYFFRALFS